MRFRWTSAVICVIALSLVSAWLISGCRRDQAGETSAEDVGAASSQEPAREPAGDAEEAKVPKPAQADQGPHAESMVGEPAEKPQAEAPRPAPKPAPKPALAAPSIDSSDPSLAQGPRPELPTDGSPVVITYRVPSMFSLNFKGRETGEGSQGISFMTMTITGDAGTDTEIHFVLRDRAKPIQPIFRLTAKTAEKAQTWKKSITGLDIEAELLDYETDPGASTTGPALVVVKVRLSATPQQ